MRTLVFVICGVLSLAATLAQADDATEQAIIKAIIDANAYNRENLRGKPDTIAAEGSLEFWSSGGLLHEVPADAPEQEFESFSLNPKHITVITLVPGQIAIAQYYSEGSMHLKDGPMISNYRTRATQVFVKEGGQWKVRAAHWSPIAGGAGTTQTSVDD